MRRENTVVKRKLQLALAKHRDLTAQVVSLEALTRSLKADQHLLRVSCPYCLSVIDRFVDWFFLVTSENNPVIYGAGARG